MGDAQKLTELLSGDGLINFVLIILGLMSMLKLIDSVVDIIKKWSKGKRVDEQRKSCDAKFANDQRRLDTLEAGQDALVYGVAELLGHALHNGNSDEMAKAEQKLKKWLYER